MNYPDFVFLNVSPKRSVSNVGEEELLFSNNSTFLKRNTKLVKTHSIEKGGISRAHLLKV